MLVHTSILVVDDDKTVSSVLRKTLESMNPSYRVHVARDGREALACLKQTRVDLILLDLWMPEMDGYETLRRIRGDEALARLPIAVLTGFEDEALRGFDANGPDALIVKPIRAADLKVVIHACLRLARERESSNREIRGLEWRYESLTRVLVEQVGREKATELVDQAASRPPPAPATESEKDGSGISTLDLDSI